MAEADPGGCAWDAATPSLPDSAVTNEVDVCRPVLQHSVFKSVTFARAVTLNNTVISHNRKVSYCQEHVC